MKKGTKQIRFVNNGTKNYYVYDLDEDAMGKRKRVYGKTVEEVKKKIEKAEKEREAALASSMPSSKKLSDYVSFYFRGMIGKIATSKLNRQILLFKNNVFGTAFDKNIDEITEEDMIRLYDSLNVKLERKNLLEVDEILKKVLSIRKDILLFNPNSVIVPNEIKENNGSAYILSPQEYEDFLNACISTSKAFDSSKYKSSAKVITFGMLSGIKLSEIVNLKSSDFDLDNYIVNVKGQTIHLTEDCVQWINDTISSENNSYKEVMDIFINSVGKISSLQSILASLKPLAAKYGLPKGITGTTLYKSYIIYHLSKGVSVSDLSERLQIECKKIIEIQEEYKIRQMLSE